MAGRVGYLEKLTRATAGTQINQWLCPDGSPIHPRWGPVFVDSPRRVPRSSTVRATIMSRKVVSLRHHRRPVSDFNAQIVNCSASVNLYQYRYSPDPPTHGFGEPISRRVSALQFSNSSHALFPETTTNQHIKFYKRVKWTFFLCFFTRSQFVIC